MPTIEARDLQRCTTRVLQTELVNLLETIANVKRALLLLELNEVEDHPAPTKVPPEAQQEPVVVDKDGNVICIGDTVRFLNRGRFSPSTCVVSMISSNR
mmetsp:Transcript_16498/g.15924  ORF Transcript_16498/g.15924 Transcript_16498/m.15924 type:complete len:99 (+) Transcript_16498:151-447(+)